MPSPEIICVGCPLGCRVTLTISPDSEIQNMVGNQCREGKKYIMAEFQKPMRIFTATVLTEGSSRRLLSVRTDRPVPKTMLRDLMREVARIRIKPPVKMGQNIVPNILKIGTNIVATGSL